MGSDLSDIKAAIALQLCGAWRPLETARLLRHFGSATAVLGVDRASLREALGSGSLLANRITGFHDWRAVAEQISLAREAHVRLICYGAPDYPAILLEIHDPPVLIAVRGSLGEEFEIGVAVVGSRRATDYGRAVARQLGADLGRRGVTVLSGLARGIDREAHIGALEAGGRTVAVVGSGLGFPAVYGNRGLAAAIAERGAVLSEFPFGTPPAPRNFPQRNRIISGLSRAAVVVEAARRSGSLITARHALEQGREVFAVPGPVGDPARGGSHDLLRKGAYLCESADDILNVIAPQIAPAQDHRKEQVKPAEGGADVDAQVLGALRVEPLDIDTITHRSQTSPALVAAALARLELAGHARQLAGKRFSRGYMEEPPRRPRPFREKHGEVAPHS